LLLAKATLYLDFQSKIQANGGKGANGVDAGGSVNNFPQDGGGGGGGGGMVHLLGSTVANLGSVQELGGAGGSSLTLAPFGGGAGGTGFGQGGNAAIAFPSTPAQPGSTGMTFVTVVPIPEDLLF
jgi:hypothetical protein